MCLRAIGFALCPLVFVVGAVGIVVDQRGDWKGGVGGWGRFAHRCGRLKLTPHELMLNRDQVGCIKSTNSVSLNVIGSSSKFSLPSFTEGSISIDSKALNFP